MPPQKPYGVSIGRNDRNMLHIIDSEGPLCRLPDAIPASVDLTSLTQYRHQATDEAVQMTKDRRLSSYRICSMCGLSAGLNQNIW